MPRIPNQLRKARGAAKASTERWQKGRADRLASTAFPSPSTDHIATKGVPCPLRRRHHQTVPARSRRAASGGGCAKRVRLIFSKTTMPELRPCCHRVFRASIPSPATPGTSVRTRLLQRGAGAAGRMLRPTGISHLDRRLGVGWPAGWVRSIDPLSSLSSGSFPFDPPISPLSFIS